MHAIRGRLRALANVKNPDTAVQERLRLVFEMFLKVRTVTKVMRGPMIVEQHASGLAKSAEAMHPGRLPEHAGS
jgi:hypothetical protein